MTRFHAVLIDECGDEVGVTVTACSRDAAYAKLREEYPECRRCVQLESPADTRKRQRRLERWANRCYDEGHHGDFDREEW